MKLHPFGELRARRRLNIREILRGLRQSRVAGHLTRMKAAAGAAISSVQASLPFLCYISVSYLREIDSGAIAATGDGRIASRGSGAPL